MDREINIIDFIFECIMKEIFVCRFAGFKSRVACTFTPIY